MKPLNLRTASAIDLRRIVGIGPKIAADMIEYRMAHPLKDIHEISGVKRIGPKIMARIIDYPCFV